MTHHSIVKKSEEISQLLINSQLKDAFDALSSLISTHALGQYASALEDLQTTYKSMLKYTVQRANDPERHSIYKQLIVSTLGISDQIEQRLLNQYSSQIPFSFIRMQATVHLRASVSNLIQVGKQLEMVQLSENNDVPYEIKHNYQTHISEVFMALWGAQFMTDADVNIFKDLIKTSALKDYEMALITSAVSLSLWRNFDVKKFDMLFELCHTNSDLVKQRAYVGLLIAVYKYNERLPYFSSITSRFSLLSEDKSFIKSLESIIIQFIRSKESEKIAKRFQEEIIPEMAKMSPIIREKLDSDKMDDDGADDKNPDWQAMLDDVPGLTDTMKEISNLQMEGADVFLSTFSMLKSFPFFNALHNWLVPFTSQYPDIMEQTKETELKPFIKGIGQSHFLCNSDKYSFMLSLEQVPDSQRRAMASALGADLDGMKEIEKKENALSKNRGVEFISNQYIQDLYRLFNLHPHKKEFDNFFAKSLDFHNKTVIHQLIEDTKVWRNVAEYYFAKNYFKEAAELYDELLTKKNTDVELLQKRGYCAQKLGLLREAITYYHKADLVDSDNSWTVRKLAFCYRALGDLSAALSHYKTAANLQPKNVNLQYAVANCHLGLKNHQEALNIYFKIELESKSNKKIWRPIAWCSFVLGKLAQAQKYYHKLIMAEPSPYDYLNAGHVELALQENALALELYKKAVELFDGDITKFLAVFEQDKTYILSYPIDKKDIPILIDRLRYDLDF